MEILSPITGSANTSLVLEMDVARIVSLYKKEQDLDVTRYFNGRKTIELRICNDTGYRFYYPMDIYGDDVFYQHLQKTGLYYLKEKWEYDKAISLIKNDQKVLEIGSGAGFFMRKLKEQRRSSLSGLELNTHQVREAQNEGFDVINSTIEGFARTNAGAFDVVVFLQVLEHVPDIRSFISASLQALRPGGQMIICVPYNNPYLYRHDLYHTLNLPPHHAGLWDKRSFRQLPVYFPMKLNGVYIEPLSDYKKWYQVQQENLKERNNPLNRLMSLVPPMIYKNSLRLMRHMVEGRNILVEYIKN